MSEYIDYDGFIGIFDNFFDEEFINQLRKYYKQIDDLADYQGRYRPAHIQNDEQLYMFDANRIWDVHAPWSRYFFEVLNEKIIPDYFEKFSILKDREYRPYQLKMKRIPAGGGFHQWHYESTGDTLTRKIVIQLYLNEGFDGGETEFLYQQKRIDAKKNRLLVWPADWTFTHRGNPPLGKDKYILGTWLEEVNNGLLSHR
jgi:hypothetical protein